MITKLEHVGLSVSNLDRSIAFYRDILGLELLRILELGADSELGEVVGLPGCSARIAHLESGGTILELFEYLDPRGGPIPEGRSQADNGYIHVGFASTDARQDYARLMDHGVRAIGAPIELRPDVWLFYFYGPDGEVCELRETPPDPEDS